MDFTQTGLGSTTNIKAQFQDELYKDMNIDTLDPLVHSNFKLIYQNTVSIELRVQQNDEKLTQNQVQGQLEPVNFKIYAQFEQAAPRDPQKKIKESTIKKLKFVLQSDSDLYFDYVVMYDDTSFQKLKKDQQVTADLQNFPDFVTTLLNKAVSGQGGIFVFFIMHKDGFARLDFIQNLEYKFLEVLSLDFFVTDEDQIKQSIQYRYNILRSKMKIVETRTIQTYDLLRGSNPQMLQFIQQNISTVINT